MIDFLHLKKLTEIRAKALILKKKHSHRRNSSTSKDMKVMHDYYELRAEYHKLKHFWQTELPTYGHNGRMI